MKNFIVAISFILLCTSCLVHKGQWVSGQCRPKNPNFKLLKIPFKGSDKLVFNRVYIADDFTKSAGYIFYPDGRLIYVHSKDGFALQPEDVIEKKWNNAPAIGYWRIINNVIETEYFSCANSGDYIEKRGEISGDTLIFERYFGTSNPFKNISCPEKYVLSNLGFD